MMVYFFVFAIYICNMCWIRKSLPVNGSHIKERSIKYRVIMFTMFIFSTLLIILFYGLRVNVGTDYSSYTRIYYEIRGIDVWNYIKMLFSKKIQMEFGYYLINRISYFIYDNEHTVFILTAFIIFGAFFVVLHQYKGISWGFATFIFLLTQYCYAVNGVRFAIAYGLVLLGFYYIITDEPIKYVGVILLATLFHSSAILCLLFWLLKDFKNKRLVFFRNMLLYLGILLTPVVIRVALTIFFKIPIFERYLRRYPINLDNNSIKFLWRCLPVIVVIAILIKYYHIEMGKYHILYNIELCRIPLLYIGNFYQFAGRLDRYAWVSEIILVPYIIAKIPNKKNQIFVYICFAMWYFFIFFIYYVVQGGDLFPYRMVFM